MSQFGGGNMGGVSLPASGMVPQPFNNMPDGPIAQLVLTISLSLKSTAGAFAAVVTTSPSGAAEGVDDLDLLLNAIFTQLGYFPTQGFQAGILTPAQWRTVLGGLNLRDLGGSFVNGVSIPTSAGSATAFKITMVFPVSLDGKFADGDICQNGSTRMKSGELDYYITALTPTVVLANGSAVVSALGVNINVFTGAGTADDIGCMWQVNRVQNLMTRQAMSPGTRLAIWSTTASSANVVTGYNVGPFSNITPAQMQARYQLERLAAGGFDITTRITPLVDIEPNRRFRDFVTMMGSNLIVEAISGVSSQALYDILLVPPPASAVQNVSAQVNGGGPVTIEHPAPPTIPQGDSVPAQLAPFLPVRVLPGVSSPKAGQQVASSPAAAAQQAIQKTVKANAFTNLFGRK